MRRSLRSGLAAAAAAAILAAPGGAGAVPPPYEEGWPCRHDWTAESLSHGPVAMLNGVILPVRNFASGFGAGWRGALLAPFSAGVGLAQGMGLVGLGAFEMLTGGYFNTVPPKFAHLNAEPMVQLPESRRDYNYSDFACPRLGNYAAVPDYQTAE